MISSVCLSRLFSLFCLRGPIRSFIFQREIKEEMKCFKDTSKSFGWYYKFQKFSLHLLVALREINVFIPQKGLEATGKLFFVLRIYASHL